MGRRRAVPGRQLPRSAGAGREWNGRYRDDVRRFWRGDPGMAAALATRLCGSADLYEAAGRLPRHSINFVTCHDGFTLCDLVSYNHKHNEANGEGNRDGMRRELLAGTAASRGRPTTRTSWRCAAGRRKNLMATLMLSQGVPMLLAGDEFLRTQAATTTPGARTTRSAGSTGRWPRRTPTSCASSAR